MIESEAKMKMNIDAFDYDLPEHLIAQKQLEKR